MTAEKIIHHLRWRSQPSYLYELLSDQCLTAFVSCHYLNLHLEMSIQSSGIIVVLISTLCLCTLSIHILKKTRALNTYEEVDSKSITENTVYAMKPRKWKKQISGRHNNADRCYAFKMQNGKAFMPLRCFLKKTMLYIKAHVHRLIDWSYIVLRPVLERIFYSDTDVIIADNGLPNLGICSMLTALSSYRNPYSTIPAMGCMVSPQ